MVYLGNGRGRSEILIEGDPCISARNSVIKYIEKLDHYEIMDLSDGSGTFLRITRGQPVGCEEPLIIVYEDGSTFLSVIAER